MATACIKIISDGVIKRDAGSMFGPIPKVTWENMVATDRRNRVTLGLNCLLLQMGGKNVLVDTGVGPKEVNGHREEYGLVPSRLIKEIRSIGLTNKDIDAVILTDLDFDHCGGCTRLDRSGEYVPTFPRARYYVQAACYEDAINPNERCRGDYRQEDFQPIEECGQFDLLDGDAEILPGLAVKVAGGPSRGHQIILITMGGERIAFLGDLVPTPFHLDLASIPAYDLFPEETLTMKREILDQAEKEGWLLIFAHAYDQKAGYLQRWNGQRALRPVEL